MKKVILFLLAGSLLTFNSCTKTGPQGPPGNANVIGENPFTVHASTWTFTSNYGGPNVQNAYVASFNDANITSDVANYGLVMAYIQYPDGTWKALPDVVGITSYSFNFSAGGFDIYYSDVDGSTPNAPNTETFRIVVVPSSLRKANPNTNWKNYDEAVGAIGQGNNASAVAPSSASATATASPVQKNTAQ
jgi:hypothetical protein